jgi:hypothetical protein
MNLTRQSIRRPIGSRAFVTFTTRVILPHGLSHGDYPNLLKNRQLYCRTLRWSEIIQVKRSGESS